MSEEKLIVRSSAMRVLECIRNLQSISRARISSITGLSKPIVSQIVDELLEKGIVKEYKKVRVHLKVVNARPCWFSTRLGVTWPESMSVVAKYGERSPILTAMFCEKSSIESAMFDPRMNWWIKYLRCCSI